MGLVGLIDQPVGNKAKNKHLAYGQAVKCTIFNEVNFVSRTLHLYSEYFENNPMSHLLDTLLLPSQMGKNIFKENT
ncbi:DUF4277 domain-containing protein [Neochlamydia sp. TUME1]|uniref:DUF4277 domain-containing protein n=1 Tax=Neochlamydia sp. TUME1 TaxID=1478174 RepID=UPI0034D17072